MAAQGSRLVALEAGYLTDENKDQILQKAHSHAQGLAGKAKDYKPE